MAETLENVEMQGKVTFYEPETGWSVESYERELDEYAAVRGWAPQSVTMHPDTAAALALEEGHGDPSLTRNIPFLVTSTDYDRDTITLYF
jgi:hypothetical protein